MSYVPFAKNSSGKSGEIKKKKSSDKVLIAQLSERAYLLLNLLNVVSVLAVRFVVVCD